jgi:thiamine biosynthesis lipoprotein
MAATTTLPGWTRRDFLRAGIAAAGAGAAVVLLRPSQLFATEGEYYFGGEVMGTAYNVKLVAPMREEALRIAARDAVRGALDAVDARMSTFKRDSELTKLNRHAGPRPFALSAETFALLQTAHRVSDASGGAFDVTAGPLVNAWGFGPARNPRVPPAHERAALRERVGYRLLDLDARRGAARKAHPAMYVDLSGIAKGHGVDRAAAALDALGIAHYVIEAGGELRARGRNIRGEPWQVAIEEPQAGPRTPRIAVPLEAAAMATSGDYRIYFERNGHRYCHEIDPVAGSPVTNRLTSVTVVAPDCATADAMATALMILGPERGSALAEKLALGAYFITRGPDGALADRATSRFAALGARRLRHAA